MAFIINNGAVLKMAVQGENGTGGREIVNTYNFQLVSGGGVDWETLFDDFIEIAEEIITILKAIQTAVMVWKGISLATLDNNFVSGFLPFAADIPGTKAGDQAPPGAAAMVFFSTGYSRIQPRKYFGPINATDLSTGGAWDTPVQDVMEDLISYLLVNQSTSAMTVRYGTARPGGTFYPVIGGSYNIVANYQRRRRL